MGPLPKNIIMLTADAFGVLPPIARLTPDQAMYHFLSGYTAKVAGTEIGVTEPEATFSTCFGAPFMPRHPSVYGNLLKKRIAEGGVDCWLVNTGWTGGKYGTGKRMPIKETRALLNAALDGSLKNVEFRKDPNFGFDVPVAVPGVDSSILDPRSTWADKEDYDRTAAKLVDLFIENFAEFAEHVDEGVRQAGPQVTRCRLIRPVIRSGSFERKSEKMTEFPVRHFLSDDAVAHVGEGLLARTLPREEWTHEAHLAATTYLILRHPEIDLDVDLPGIISRYNESVGGVNDDTQGYHDTITRAYLRGVRLFLEEADTTSADPRAGQRAAACLPWASATGHSASGRKTRLMSVEARRKWVEPDLAAMP